MGMVHYGIHAQLEEVATALIRESLENASPAQKRDILTPWKEADRRNREVYAASGTPDPAVRKGMYKRVYNWASPHLNSRDGHFQGMRVINDHSAMDPAGRSADTRTGSIDLGAADRLWFDEIH